MKFRQKLKFFMRFSVLTSFAILLCSCSLTKQKNLSSMHYPMQNPQGLDFEADPEFVRSYQNHLATKSSQDIKMEALGIATSRSAIKTYDLTNLDNLEAFSPKDAGWNRKHIPAPKSKTKKVVENIKRSVSDLLSKKEAASSKANKKATSNRKSYNAKKVENRDLKRGQQLKSESKKR